MDFLKNVKNAKVCKELYYCPIHCHLYCYAGIQDDFI